MNQCIFEQAIQWKIPGAKTVVWKEPEKYHLSIQDTTNQDKEQKPLLMTSTITKHFWGAALTSYSDKKYNQWVSLEFKHLKDLINHSPLCLSFSSNCPLTGNVTWMSHNSIL